MASNPPGKCCFEGFYHDGKPVGCHREIYGVDTYVVEPESSTGNCCSKEPATDKFQNIIVILTDVYGNRFNNVLLLADQLAKHSNSKVYIPDILFNDPVLTLDGSTDFKQWMANHSPEKTGAFVTDFLTKLKQEESPKQLALIGYCFGAKFVIQQLSKTKGLADIGAIAHPSLVTMEEVADIATDKPLLISAAENDYIFPDELRHQSILKLKEIGATYQLDLFSGVSHGYAARGDISIPMVKYAKEKTLADQIHWFKHFA